MKIYLNDLTGEGADYQGELPAAILELDRDYVVRCEEPIRYRLRAVVVSDELLVDGELDVNLRVHCRRCDDVFPESLEKLAYHFDTDVENWPEYVDLTEDLRESIILAFPSYPVCSPDCKGLCPQCGMDLNKSECECSTPADSRWAALGSLANKGV